MRGGLNSLRYAIGVLAASELFLVALFPRVAPALVGANLASRLILLYTHIPAVLFPLPLIVGVSVACLVVLAVASRLRPAVCVVALLIACPPACRSQSRSLDAPTGTIWKPALSAVRSQGLAILVLTDGGYFAGHVVAAGNPVDPSVRAVLPELMDMLAPAHRPPYLAILFSPGSEGEATWRTHYAPDFLRSKGYAPMQEGKSRPLAGEKVQ